MWQYVLSVHNNRLDAPFPVVAKLNICPVFLQLNFTFKLALLLCLSSLRVNKSFTTQTVAHHLRIYWLGTKVDATGPFCKNSSWFFWLVINLRVYIVMAFWGTQAKSISLFIKQRKVCFARLFSSLSDTTMQSMTSLAPFFSLSFFIFAFCFDRRDLYTESIYYLWKHFQRRNEILDADRLQLRLRKYFSFSSFVL